MEEIAWEWETKKPSDLLRRFKFIWFNYHISFSARLNASMKMMMMQLC